MNNLYLQPIDKNVAKRMIVKNHYSHAWTMCNVALGIFEKGSDNTFFDTTDDKLIGVIVYGIPIGRQVINGLSPLLQHGQVLELTRLWIKDETPKNTESYCISMSFEWLKKNKPEIKALVSYSDPSAGHKGGIYQATNWLYQRLWEDDDVFHSTFVSIVPPPNYNWCHPRTLNVHYGTMSMNKLKDILPKPYWIKDCVRKYRYLYILTNKVEKKKIITSLKHPISHYPKELPDIDMTITKVE